MADTSLVPLVTPYEKQDNVLCRPFCCRTFKCSCPTIDSMYYRSQNGDIHIDDSKTKCTISICHISRSVTLTTAQWFFLDDDGGSSWLRDTWKAVFHERTGSQAILATIRSLNAWDGTSTSLSTSAVWLQDHGQLTLQCDYTFALCNGSISLFVRDPNKADVFRELLGWQAGTLSAQPVGIPLSQVYCLLQYPPVEIHEKIGECELHSIGDVVVRLMVFENSMGLHSYSGAATWPRLGWLARLRDCPSAADSFPSTTINPLHSYQNPCPTRKSGDSTESVPRAPDIQSPSSNPTMTRALSVQSCSDPPLFIRPKATPKTLSNVSNDTSLTPKKAIKIHLNQSAHKSSYPQPIKSRSIQSTTEQSKSTLGKRQREGPPQRFRISFDSDSE